MDKQEIEAGWFIPYCHFKPMRFEYGEDIHDESWWACRYCSHTKSLDQVDALRLAAKQDQQNMGADGEKNNS